MNTPTQLMPRYPAQMVLLHRALEGDTQAANGILQYLSSDNPSLRQIMLATLHDAGQAEIWQHLLHCLALQRWGGAYAADMPVDCERRSDPEASHQIDRSIVEAFLSDEWESEPGLKTAVLRQALDSESGPVRFAAAYLLGLRGAPESIPTLAEAVETAEPEWQVLAVRALAGLKDERAGPPLVRALAQGDRRLHEEARRALNNLGAYARPALQEALTHPDGHIRWHAARGLGQIGDARAVHILAEGLRDSNYAVRWASARALAGLDLQALPAVLDQICRGDLGEPFREAAYHALHAMPSRQAQEHIQPLLAALRGPAANVAAPMLARQVLASQGFVRLVRE